MKMTNSRHFSFWNIFDVFGKTLRNGKSIGKDCDIETFGLIILDCFYLSHDLCCWSKLLWPKSTNVTCYFNKERPCSMVNLGPMKTSLQFSCLLIANFSFLCSGVCSLQFEGRVHQEVCFSSNINGKAMMMMMNYLIM